MNYTMIVDDLSFVRPQPALYGTKNATMRFGEILLEDPRALWRSLCLSNYWKKK